MALSTGCPREPPEVVKNNRLPCRCCYFVVVVVVVAVGVASAASVSCCFVVVFGSCVFFFGGVGYRPTVTAVSVCGIA